MKISEYMAPYQAILETEGDLDVVMSRPGFHGGSSMRDTVGVEFGPAYAPHLAQKGKVDLDGRELLLYGAAHSDIVLTGKAVCVDCGANFVDATSNGDEAHAGRSVNGSLHENSIPPGGVPTGLTISGGRGGGEIPPLLAEALAESYTALFGSIGNQAPPDLGPGFAPNITRGGRVDGAYERPILLEVATVELVAELRRRGYQV